MIGQICQRKAVRKLSNSLLSVSFSLSPCQHLHAFYMWRMDVDKPVLTCTQLSLRVGIDGHEDYAKQKKIRVWKLNIILV